MGRCAACRERIVKTSPLAMLLILSGCAFFFNTSVDDMRTTDVSLVKIANLPRDWGLPSQDDRMVLLITVKTAYDMRQAAEMRDLSTLHAEIDSCSDSTISAWSRVWDSYGPIGFSVAEFGNHSLHSSTAAASNLNEHSYKIWFNYKTIGHWRYGRNVDYNLAERPRDICMKIRAVPYMGVGTGLISNIVVIPKRQIAEVLRPIQGHDPPPCIGGRSDVWPSPRQSDASRHQAADSWDAPWQLPVCK
jgi:hypothetical protein